MGGTPAQLQGRRSSCFSVETRVSEKEERQATLSTTKRETKRQNCAPIEGSGNASSLKSSKATSIDRQPKQVHRLSPSRARSKRDTRAKPLKMLVPGEQPSVST